MGTLRERGESSQEEYRKKKKDERKSFVLEGLSLTGVWSKKQAFSPLSINSSSMAAGASDGKPGW